MIEPMGSVAWIAIAPVKSMALHLLERADLDRTGIRGDRAFAIVDPEGRLVNGKRIGPLATIRPEVTAGGTCLTLRFPDGLVVEGDVDLGAPMVAMFHGEPRFVRPTIGPWSEALSAWAGVPLRIVAPVEVGNGIDRGPSATLLSTSALARLAQAGGESTPLDGRRFRMNFGIDGIEAYAEDDWIGRDVRVGSALVRPIGNVGRCAITTQDPDTGRPSFDTLRYLKITRGDLDTTEPLPCGVYADVIEPGEVVLGDQIGPVRASVQGPLRASI
ncbi:MAG TPA: MOSC N-terminal beta barrel domain-containing protein [Candidatus Acidoferrum sp.]|nr:MOSC N-terminal beta barrel domain-containing protein [Candidatus Acidoferrum sp.]